MMRDDLRFSIHLALAKDMIQYGLPFVLVGVGSWSLASLDRWMLASFLDLNAVGEYAFAMRISFVVSFLSLAFGQAWAPMVFKLKESRPEDYLAIYADTFLSFTLVISILAAVVSIFSSEAQVLIFDNKFQETSIAILCLCFASIVQATTHFTAIGISLSRKTRYFAIFTWSTATLSVTANIIAIPRWGIDIAAFINLCSATILSSMYFLISQREFPMRFLKRDLYWFILLMGYIGFGSATLVLKLAPFESIGLKMLFLMLALIGVSLYLKKMLDRYGR
jgi:O-antigen/teichoic acid export membrane protein